MKNLIIMMFILLMVVSCDMTIIDDFWYLSKDYNIKSMDDVVYYVEKINYETDMSRYGRNICQTPHETEVKKVGNCIDKSILGLALAYKYLGIKGKYHNADVNNAGYSNHVMYSINGKMYNKAEGNYKIIETIEFDQIPYYASTKR